MNVLGLDLSLAAPGFATQSGPWTLTPKHKGVDRLFWFYGYIGELVAAHEIHVAIVEGYAFGSAFGREALGELGGVVRLRLHKMGIPFVIAAPTALKKYATGKGNAKKDEVLAAAIKRSGLDITDNNAADAWWLYQMGCTKYAPELAVSMPAVNMSALDKLEWETL